MKLEKGSQNTCQGKAMNALTKLGEKWIPARQDERGGKGTQPFFPLYT